MKFIVTYDISIINIRLCTLLLFLQLLSCGTTEIKNYKIETDNTPSKVYIDGNLVCDNTPCITKAVKEKIFVGIAYSPDGYECEGHHNIFIKANSDTQNQLSYGETIDACLSSNNEEQLKVNLQYTKNTESEFLKPYKIKPKLKYIMLGNESVKFHNKINTNEDNNYPLTTFSIGNEYILNPGNRYLVEFNLNRNISNKNNQYGAGVMLDIHSTLLSMFFLSTGLQYKNINNDFALDGIYPYFGGGLLLNSKTFFEFWNIFKGPFIKRDDFSYNLGALGYDIYIKTGAYLQDRNNWDFQSTIIGLRLYY